MPSVIQFRVPLPPPALRSNSRAHWRTKVNAKQDYSRAVWGWWQEALSMSLTAPRTTPWAAADVHYEWHYAGVAPDIGNLGQNLKALQDIICMAPDNGLQENHTIYLGLVENDRNITPSYSLVKEARRAAQCVVVTVTQRSEPT